MERFREYARRAAESDDGPSLKMKLGMIIREMVDEGSMANPRSIFGKGDVKGQAERYKQRIKAEKRFQCKLCQHVFSSKSTLDNHIVKRVCTKRKPELYECVSCGYRSTNKGHIRKHKATKKHKKAVREKNI